VKGRVSTRRSQRRSNADPAVSFLMGPDEMWGRVLLGPTGSAPGSADDFEARVERTWEYIKSAFFSVDEHERLREVLAARMEAG
jgi:hypothetical protein